MAEAINQWNENTDTHTRLERERNLWNEYKGALPSPVRS